MSKAEAVRVIVRCRPLNKKEQEAGMERIIEMDPSRGAIMVKNPKDEKIVHEFVYDAVFDWNSTQKAVYDECVFPIVESALEGYNGTIFAYGQTGTGKTHTMTGNPKVKELRGVIPNAFEHIFDRIATNTDPNIQYLVRASFLEIYNEEIRDLLGNDPKKRLELKEHPDRGVYVKDLSSFVVKNIPEMEKAMDLGNNNRTVGATAMNQQSSRSHSIFTITIETCGPGPTGEPQVRMGKLNLVDLAGSERQSKTEAEGLRLKEAAKINLSLSALGNVISALVDGKTQHIPYRDSKLTRLLQDSLGGNSKTVMIATCGPVGYNYDETIGTLRYASRAKQIKNKPKINEDPKDALIRQYQEEIEKLKKMLESQGGGGAPAEGGTVTEVIEYENIPGVDPELLKQLQSEKESEIMSILNQKGLAEQEKQRIAQQLKEIAEKNAKHRSEKEELAKKLAAMQGNLLVGGVNLLDEAERLEQIKRQQERELEQKELEEKRLKRVLAQRQDELLIQEEKYSSLQEEVQVKTKKLQKLWNKTQMAKEEIRELQEEWQAEKTDLLNTIRDLTKQLKLKMLVTNSFVPPEELRRIEMRASFDEETGEWKISNIQVAGNQIMKQGLIEIDDTQEQQRDEYTSSDAMPNVYFTYK